MTPNSKAKRQGFTLIELLCVVAIIGLLAALLLPALKRGQAQAYRVRCAANLRQMGLSFLDFAHTHDDKFPIQVSTNQGGSSEFLDAARTINGEFYFSYRHFLPLAADLRTPKLLVCPADTRVAATNYDVLRNENLSYFVGANPLLGRSDSILAGDRNITPAFDSRAQVGGVRYVRWTRELHQNKGNVLFADGHVDELKDVLSMSNLVASAPAELLVPSVKLPPPVPVVAGQGAYQGSGTTPLPQPGSPGMASVPLGTNALIRTTVVSNLAIISGPPRTPPGGVSSPDPGPAAEPPKLPVAKTSPPPVIPQTQPLPPEQVLVQPPSQEPVEAPAPTAQASPPAGYRFPWWLLVVALLAILEVLRRRLRGRPPGDVDS